MRVTGHHFLGRVDLRDQRNEPVGGGQDHPVILRHHALGIAKEGEDAEREEQERPADDLPVETDQEHEADEHRDRAELAAFGMNRRP